MVWKRTIATLICASSIGLHAQTNEDSAVLPQDSGQRSAILRGPLSLRYNIRYTGHNYWITTEFLPGKLFMDGKWHELDQLNIDASTQQIVAKADASLPPVDISRTRIERAEIGGKAFHNLSAMGYDLPEGFYEVIYSDDTYTVYRHVVKSLENVISADASGPGAATSAFEEKVTYYVGKGGAVQKISKGKANTLAEGKSQPKMSRRAAAMKPETPYDGIVSDFPDSLNGDRTIALKGDVIKVAGKDIYTTVAPGFFSEDKKDTDDELLKLINAEHEVVTFANKVYDIGSADKKHGDKAVVRGVVRDVLTGEPITGVAVFDDATKAYVMTDEHGVYQIRLPIGDNTLSFSGYSLEDLHLGLNVMSDGALDVVMKEKVTTLKGAVVSAEGMASHRDARMGIEKVRINTISKIPSAFGESDVIKVVLTLPGVKSVGEAANGFNVRGGSTDQNLILFNDGTIYNPSHLFGLFSAFDTDVINDIELYKSSIPAEFGGRISSVLDVRGREGNSNKVTGSMGLGLLTSRLHLEGPVGKKTTFIAGGRTTYSNWIFNLLPESSSYSGGDAAFNDLNASVTHRINDRNTLHASGYWSRDNFSFDGDTTFHYSNLNASIKWHSIATQNTTLDLTAGYDHYVSSLENSFNEFSGYIVDTGIDQVFAKLGFKTLLDDRNTLTYGVHGIHYDLNPGIMQGLGDDTMVAYHEIGNTQAIEGAIFVSDSWKPTDALSFDFGLRHSMYTSLVSRKLYQHPELRLSGKYSIKDNLSLKAGFNSMTQYIHLISNTASVSPIDAWHLSDASTRPQTGWQAASGLYWTVSDGALDLSVEGYYKKMRDYLDYKSGAVLIMNDHLADDLVGTFGKAYGVEFMAKKTVGRLSGWMSYTYSRTLLREMEDRGISTINGGDWYAAAHDKPHDIKVVGNYKFTHRYSASFNVDYSTGRPVTLPVAVYDYGGGPRLGYSARNGYRIPDYFRLDVAMNVDPGHYLKQLTHMTLTFGVYNVTGRKNAYSVFYSTHGGLSVNGYMISVFACPIPYINLNIKFG